MPREDAKGLAAIFHRCPSAVVHPAWPSLLVIPVLFLRSHLPWRRVLPLHASGVSTLCGYSTIIYPEGKSKKRPERYEACWSLVYVTARLLNLDLTPWCYLCCFCHCVVFLHVSPGFYVMWVHTHVTACHCLWVEVRQSARPRLLLLPCGTCRWTQVLILVAGIYQFPLRAFPKHCLSTFEEHHNTDTSPKSLFFYRFLWNFPVLVVLQ